MHDIAVFSGSAHRGLAVEICEELKTPLHPARITRFANDCLEGQSADWQTGGTIHDRRHHH